MSITEILKSQDFFKNLVEKKAKNLFPNALMFFCQDDITAFHALVLTALLLQYPTFELFNESSAVFQKIASGIDLDVKVYPKSGDKLLVADSNEIVAEAFMKPTNLPYKIFILKNFENATEEAQNKLLKILEEPPANVYFLIGSASEERVLPTIRSRCEKIQILPLPSEELKKIATSENAQILGEGYVGKTLKLEKMAGLDEIVKFGVSLFCELKNSKQVLKFSKQFLDRKEDFELIFKVMSLCVEDILKIKCESENLCSLKRFLSELKDVEPEFSVEALCEISKLICRMQEKFEFNANITVAIDNFLLKILEVKFICK